MISPLSAQGLTKSFGQVRGLISCSFTLEPGQWLSIFGPSGSGKTTLLRLLAGLITPDSGTINWPGLGKPGLLVYQDYLLFPHLTVLENAAYGLRARGQQKKESHLKALSLLERLGIGEKASAWPHELSAGQQQRTALARALILHPDLLLLDEPFANLDPQLRQSTARLLKDLQKEHGFSLVCVSHDQTEAAIHADQCLWLIEGHLSSFPTEHQFLKENL